MFGKHNCMSELISPMSFHLLYRLSIAEMNADINVLRIFEDYIAELSKENNQEVIDNVQNFHGRFIKLRREIDDLRHEMHLAKMKIAETAREHDNAFTMEEHNDLQKRYTAFQDVFDAIKKEFSLFTTKWIK